ncbi:hypothetical protein Emag_007010 [Eimeria magna]
MEPKAREESVSVAGSWLWRAFPSHFLGLAEPRGAVVPPGTRASEPQVTRRETQSERQPQGHFSLSTPQKVRELSNVRGKNADKANQHKRCLALKQGPDDSIIKGPSLLPIGSDADNAENAGEVAAPALAPRPKRRRLVSSHVATQGVAPAADQGRLRSQLLAFTRKHLPLLGELVCPHLESLLNKSEILSGRPSLVAPSIESSLNAASEFDAQQGRAAMQLLKSVSSFLLEAAGDSLGMLLAEAPSTRPVSNDLQSGHSLSQSRSSRLTTLLTASSGDVCDDSRAALTLPGAEHSSHPHHQTLQEHGCFELRVLRGGQEHQTRHEQQQLSQQQEGKEFDEFALLRLLQHPPLPRSTWSHGVFFKYAFVDLDFECLVTFRICLCHHPLFIFYKEHEKGLHVLHVDGVFNPTGGGAQEKKELWKERLAYTYVCGPAASFEQTTGHQESRRHQPPMQELEAAPADSEAGAPSFRALQHLNSGHRRFETWREVPPGNVDRLANPIPEIDLAGDIEALQKNRLPPPKGAIKLCSARASLCPVSTAKASLKKLQASPLLPHVGPQMTGSFPQAIHDRTYCAALRSCDLFCLEMWAVLCLCRDQMAPPTLPQYVRALKRLWSEALTQQQRDIYDNIITPKYIARRLRTPDLTFEALPPWWQQQESSRFSNGG